MGLHDADDHVLAATLAAESLTQHVVGFADTGRISKKELKDALFLFWGRFFQPLFRRLRHERDFLITAFSANQLESAHSDSVTQAHKYGTTRHFIRYYISDLLPQSCRS